MRNAETCPGTIVQYVQQIIEQCVSYQEETIKQESKLRVDRFKADLDRERDPHKKLAFASIREVPFPPVHAVEESIS